MGRNFEKRSGRNWKPEAEGIELFKKLIKDWITTPEGIDSCPPCWQHEKKTNQLFKKAENDSRPMLEFAERRLGTDGWSAICQRCGKEVFIRLP